MVLQMQLMIVYVTLLKLVEDFFKCTLWIMMTHGSLQRFAIISIPSIILNYYWYHDKSYWWHDYRIITQHYLKLKELQPEPSEDLKKKSITPMRIWPTNHELGGAKSWVFALNLWELATAAENREIEITACETLRLQLKSWDSQQTREGW